MRIKIINGQVCDPDQQRISRRELLIEDGCLTGQLSGEPEQVIDAAGLAVWPGLIDAHCHLREPGLEYKEDIASGSRSAARGGFTTITSMPNTLPVCDHASIVRSILEQARRCGMARVLPIGAVSKKQEGRELAEIGLMAEAGIVAVTDDGHPVASAEMMRTAMLYAAQFSMPVISHCEDLSLAEGGQMNEGIISNQLGLRGISTVSESAMVARDCLLAEYLGLPVHIAHVSCRASVEIIRQAKQRGAPVSSETCPHYFSLDETACLNFNTMAKMNPPLRTEDDVKAIIEGLEDGTIDIIATDHAPHHLDEKLIEFALASNGIVGLESALSLGYTFLVLAGHLTLPAWLATMTTAPARLLGQDLGTLQPGRSADVILVDLKNPYRFKADDMASKARNTPFDGWELHGRVCMTILEGRVVYDQLH